MHIMTKTMNTYMLNIPKTTRTKHRIVYYGNRILDQLEIDVHPERYTSIVDIEKEDYVLNYLYGYGKPIIRRELEEFVDSYLFSNEYIRPRSLEALATAIVAEILEHHNIKYNLKDLLSIFNISLNTFDNISYNVRMWAKQYYWKDSKIYWEIKLREVKNG